MLLLRRRPPCVVSLFCALFGGCHGVDLSWEGGEVDLLCIEAGHDVQCERVLVHMKRLAEDGW